MLLFIIIATTKKEFMKRYNPEAAKNNGAIGGRRFENDNGAIRGHKPDDGNGAIGGRFRQRDGVKGGQRVQTAGSIGTR